MIFVVVGTQEPFDRLIRSIDHWAGKRAYRDIYAQISNSEYKPVNFESTDFIPPDIFNSKFNSADLIVSHAGMGTIISALQFSKPIIVMPRLSCYHEHRNDHQLATAKSFGKLGFVNDVYNEEELFAALDAAGDLKPSPVIGSGASESLIETIKKFIEEK